VPRAARGLVGGQVYHVLNRGNGRANVFHKPEDFAAFVKLIAEAKERHPVKVIAYCLMTNHFHLVVKPTTGADLSNWMRWLMTSHVRRYHRHYGSSGHVWQGRFKSFVVKDSDHLLAVMRYVEGNPGQAQMVSSAKDWPWSSHRENLGTVSDQRSVTVPVNGNLPREGQAPEVPVPIVDVGMINLPKDWTTFVDTPLTGKELNGLRHSLHRQIPFGPGTGS